MRVHELRVWLAGCIRAGAILEIPPEEMRELAAELKDMERAIALSRRDKLFAEQPPHNDKRV